MVPLMLKASSVADYVEELRVEELAAAEFRVRLNAFRDGQRALAQGRIREANARLLEVARSRPRSAAAAVAVAAAQTAGQDLYGAQKTMLRAVRLRPDDAGLAELQRRVTQATGNTPGPASPEAPSKKPVKVGDVLGGWRLEQLTGQGGWGQVFKAVRKGQTRALKVMHPDLSRDPAFEERFRGEILTLAGLRGHKHLVEIHDFGYAADVACWYIVMEFVEGDSLERRLRVSPPMPPKDLVRLFLRVADGLAAAHARGIVHRDVKPANILVRPDDSPVLVDFGLAAVADGEEAGYTALFAAPEQAHDLRADARSDVYSLAASLYYSLAYADERRRKPYLFAEELVPARLRGVLRRAMERDPERRYPNAGAFRDALRAAVTTGGEEAERRRQEAERQEREREEEEERQHEAEERRKFVEGICDLAKIMGRYQDDATFAKRYRREAEQGDVHCQVVFGTMYELGRGVARDDNHAVKWYRSAAERGSELAQNLLAGMYEQGRGVKRDDAAAAKWYRKAADKGVPGAQIRLGCMYRDGRGVGQRQFRGRKVVPQGRRQRIRRGEGEPG